MNTIAERSWNKMVQETRAKILFLLETHFGPRCPEVVDGCEVCRRYTLMDNLLESPYESKTTNG